MNNAKINNKILR